MIASSQDSICQASSSSNRLCQLLTALQLITVLTACGGGELQTTPADNGEVGSVDLPRLLTGVFIDSAVENLSYHSGDLSGTTDESGQFQFFEGNTVRFSIGGIEFPEVAAKETITPLDLFDTNLIQHEGVINVVRLLQTLDSDSNAENGIQISDDTVAKLADVTIDFINNPTFDSNVLSLLQDSGVEVTEIIAAEIAITHFYNALIDENLIDTSSADLAAYTVIDDQSGIVKLVDTDNDGAADLFDLDDDGDKTADTLDAFPLNSQESSDHDNDGTGDNADNDDDNDGVADSLDLFPLNSRETIDTDNDGLGDNSDPDVDNDGALNEADTFPFNPELINLQVPVQGTWQTECVETPGSNGDVYQIEGVGFSDTEIGSVIAYFDDTLCRSYFFSTLLESSGEFVSSVSYGEVLRTIHGTPVTRITVGETEVLRALSTYSASPRQQFISIEGDALYFGRLDPDNPGYPELLRATPYHKVNALIGQVNTTTNPVVVRLDPVGIDITEDRTRPSQGSVFTSDHKTLKYNGADLFSDTGPQQVNNNRVASWPGLRYGDFLVSNNPWNASAAFYPLWFQEISLIETANGYGARFEWDWGAEPDTLGSVFNTRSFPEVIFGAKSAFERSGNFANTGLPVEIFDSPEITINYNYDYEAKRSDSPTTGGTDSEFNVAIESFFHSSCDIKRSGGSDDNAVFEQMVWLKTGDRKPSGDAPRGVVATSDGRSYDVYTKIASNPAYIAYVAQTEIMDGSVLYSELLNHTQDHATEYGIYPLGDTDCLANIIIGTEIWHGAGIFNLNKFEITRSY